MNKREEFLRDQIADNIVELDCMAQLEVKNANNLGTLASVPIDAYSRAGDGRKIKYHRIAKRQLRLLAKALGLATSDYRLDTNKGGIAVCGETTLHTDTLYIQVSQSCLGPGHEIMFRQCEGRQDYGGKRNHFAPAHRLDDVQDFAEGLRRAGIL
jgi:hypothetical protein